MSHMTTFIDWTGLLACVGSAMEEDSAYNVGKAALHDMERIETVITMLTQALRGRAQSFAAQEEKP